MHQAGWSWWDIVALGGVAWTFVSFVFAFALGRVLRSNHGYQADESAAESQAGMAAPSAETIPLQPVGVPSLLDQLVPADLDDEYDTDNRSSGTRFRPVTSESGVEAVILPIPRARKAR
jgi:hypothetical protein